TTTFLFFLTHTPTTEIYTLSLHDALPIWAAGDVKLEVLLESGQAFFKLFHQPASKTLRFGNGQLAEFRPAAGDCATPKWRDPHSQTDSFQSLRQLLHIAIGDIHDEQILHVRRAQFAASKLVGQIGRPPHLLS